MHDMWLIHRCQRGDHEAFAALYQLHQQRVFRTALHLVRDPALAEDITQEVFIEVFQEIHQLRTPAAFRTWLYRLVVGKTSRSLRTDGGGRRPLSFDLMQEQQVQDSPSMGTDTPAGDSRDDTPGSTADPADLIALRIALANLPNDLRLTVMLHYYAGLAVAEVAAVLEIPAGTVKSRLHTARTRLAVALNPNEPDLPDESDHRPILKGAKA